MALAYEVVPVTAFQQNCTLLWCEQTRRAAVVDPGGDLDRLLAVVERKQIALEKVLVTHGHIDHAGGVADLAERLNLPIEGPQRDDQFWIDGMARQAQMFGFSEGGRPFAPTRWLEQGDQVSVGDVVLDVLHCPGHTPGHVVFFDKVGRLALVGDVLFAGSVGRSDLPGGDHGALIRSIRERLLPLGDDVAFVSGHGPMSTFGREQQSNPFCGE